MSGRIQDKSVRSCSLLVPLPLAARKDIILFVPLYAAGLYFYLTSPVGTDDGSDSVQLLKQDILSLALLCIVLISQLFAFLVAYWSCRVRCWLRYKQVNQISDALFVCVFPAPHCGSPSICELFSSATGTDPAKEHDQLFSLPDLWFDFNGQKYVESNGDFRPLDYPTQLTSQEYLNSKGHVSRTTLDRARLKWGKNEFIIPLPGLDELFVEHALSPFFLFQMFCVALWCLDDYWYYSVFTLVMLVIFELTVCKQRQADLQRLRQMRKPPYGIYVYRESKWTRILTNELVPGDICSLVKVDESMANIMETLVPCDMLLLHGECVVNEAMLTGESVPSVKQSVKSWIQADPTAATATLNIADEPNRLNNSAQLIRGGTSVVQHKHVDCPFPKPPDRGCVAMVIKTGFATSQGTLVRTILFSTERVSVDSAETYIFILILLVFAVFASAYVLYYGLQDERQSRWKLFLHCTMIITSVVPPELPMELSLAVTTSLARLQKMAIFCTEPYRIPIAGKLDVCCFDKTGTLTSDNLKVNGVALLSDGTAKLTATTEVPEETAFVLAGCQQLVRLQNKVVGDTMEKATVRAVKWSLGKDNTVLPRNGDKSLQLKTVQKYPFSSALKRMSVIVARQNKKQLVLTKGAPEVIADMLETIPEGYEDAYQSLMRGGNRVLALAYRSIEASGKQPTRSEVECNLKFAGLLALNCPLKPDTAQAIEQLRTSGHKVVMITGDSPLTACDVAKQLDMCSDSKVMILNVSSASKLLWTPLHPGTDSIPFDSNTTAALADKYDLVVAGASLTLLENSNSPKDYHLQMKALVPHIIVFARVSPQHKEKILGAMKACGLNTLMCGDGTNDVGALKLADIGVSIINSPEMEKRANKTRAMIQSKLAKNKVELSPVEQLRLELATLEQEQSRVVQLGDASIASPFTSRSTSILSTVHIVLQGRCTLVTTIQMFKILGLNCIIAAYSLTSLHLMGVKQGDTQATMAGLLIAALFMLLSYAKPLDVLSEVRPVTRIFATPVMASMAGQIFIHMAALLATVNLTSPYINETASDPDAEFFPSPMNSTLFLLGLCMQVNVFATNYRGAPFVQSLREYKAMHRTLFFSWILCFMLATDAVPGLCELVELVPLPSQQDQGLLVAIMLANTIGVWAWEYIIRTFVE